MGTPAPPVADTGTAVIIGGGDAPDAAYLAFVEAAGKDAPILLMSQTTEDPAASSKRSLEYFHSIGAKGMEPTVGLTIPELLAKLAKTRGVWISGGDQSRFMNTFPESTGVLEAIRAVYRRGGVVGGTSAGASLMGGKMPTGADPTVPPLSLGFCETRTGLGIFPKAIFDQHFLRRNRVSRLLSAVLENPAFLGVGIDEKAWLVVQGRKAKVYNGQVMLLRARGKGRQESGRSGGDLSLRVLLSGETFIIP
jgi:cyanophycinase